MRVLITWGSKRGGTEGIAQMIGEALRDAGVDVDLRPAESVREWPTGIDAAIVGGALYVNRWHPDARRFVRRHAKHLQRLPVWMFSSGPLDTSADEMSIPPAPQVQALMHRVGAQGHTTFGGRLAGDAVGSPAVVAMAKEHGGDFRDPERIRAWALEVASKLPEAKPYGEIDMPGSSLPSVIANGFAGWMSAAFLSSLLASFLSSSALVAALQWIVTITVFARLSVRYFRLSGARAPLPTALSWMLVYVAMEVVRRAVLGEQSALFSLGVWLPLALVFVASWITGLIVQLAALSVASARPAPPGSVLVVVGHPDKTSFGAVLGEAYRDGALESGDILHVGDLDLDEALRDESREAFSRAEQAMARARHLVFFPSGSTSALRDLVSRVASGQPAHPRRRTGEIWLTSAAPHSKDSEERAALKRLGVHPVVVRSVDRAAETDEPARRRWIYRARARGAEVARSLRTPKATSKQLRGHREAHGT